MGNKVRSVVVPGGAATLVRHVGAGACILASMLIAGCAVGPDFKAPAAPSLARTTETDLPAQSASTPAAGGEAQIFSGDAKLGTHWWHAYGSEQLDRLVDEAFANSPNVASAQAALRAAEAQLAAQRGALFPSISGSASAARQKINGASQGFPQAGSFLFTLYNASVGLSYNFDVFGGVRRGIEAQSAARDAQREALVATYQTLAANVVTAAVHEASLRAQIEATHDLIASAEHQRDLSQKQFELGGTTRSDVLSAESNVASLQATLPSLEQQLAATRSQLAVYLGQLPGEYGETGFDLSALQLPREIPVMVPADIVRQRPDVRQAEAQLHQASAQIGVATANMLPQIGISGSFGDAAASLGSFFSNNVFSLAGTITQPLFQGGALSAKRRAAIAEYDQALAQYRQTVLAAVKGVADALRALETDARALAAQYRAQAAAQESLQLIETRYGMGGATHVELLVARQDYEKARIAYVQAVAARYQDTAALFLALGGTWPSAPEREAASAAMHDETKKAQ